jgi:hypothetical protein
MFLFQSEIRIHVDEVILRKYIDVRKVVFMDRVFSTRIDNAVYRKINHLSTSLHASKKSVIEMAIEQLSKKVEKEAELSAFDQTFGVWERLESPAETVDAAKKVFRDSLGRHHQ